MRTTKNLIDELNEEASKFFDLYLIVGFESECKVVSADDSDQLDKLNELVGAGGEPIGFIGFEKEATRGPAALMTVKTRPVDEYKGDAQIKAALDKLAGHMGKHLEKTTGVKCRKVEPGWN